MRKRIILYLYAFLISMTCVYAAGVDNSEYNRKKIEEMLAVRDVTFTKAEQWAIFFSFQGNSFGPYNERELQYAIIEPLVEAHDVDALVMYAEEAISGSGLPSDKKQNIPKGLLLYEKAAELGDVDSMGIVAWYYLRGTTGVKQDERKALKWLIQYDLFHPTVENRETISKLYSGINPETHEQARIALNDEKAKEWKRKAMELKSKGGSQPEENKGRWAEWQERKKRLTQGVGDMDEIMQRFWTVKFQELMCNVEGGDAKAASEMGFYFERGFYSFRRDIARAVEFYRKAGDAGDASAFWSAGRLLVFEDSPVKDPHLGLRLLYDAYKMESSYYMRMRIIDEIIRAYKYGPGEIKNAEMAEKWSERKKAEADRVRKGGLSVTHKKWEESTEIDEYFLKSGK